MGRSVYCTVYYCYEMHWILYELTLTCAMGRTVYCTVYICYDMHWILYELTLTCAMGRTVYSTVYYCYDMHWILYELTLTCAIGHTVYSTGYYSTVMTCIGYYMNWYWHVQKQQNICSLSAITCSEPYNDVLLAWAKHEQPAVCRLLLWHELSRRLLLWLI